MSSDVCSSESWKVMWSEGKSVFWRPRTMCGNREPTVHMVLIQALATVLAPLLVFCVTSEKSLSSPEPQLLVSVVLACLSVGLF